MASEATSYITIVISDATKRWMIFMVVLLVSCWLLGQWMLYHQVVTSHDAVLEVTAANSTRLSNNAQRILANEKRLDDLIDKIHKLEMRAKDYERRTDDTLGGGGQEPPSVHGGAAADDGGGW